VRLFLIFLKGASLYFSFHLLETGLKYVHQWHAIIVHHCTINCTSFITRICNSTLTRIMRSGFWPEQNISVWIKSADFSAAFVC
jgi:hypothetical protein